MTSPDAPPRCTDRCNRMSDRGLCGWCCRRLDRELSELAGLWGRLGVALLPAAGHGDGRGSGEPSIGVRVDVLSLLGPAGEPSAVAAAAAGREYHPGDQTGADPIEPMLCSWARLVAEERHFAHRDRWRFDTARRFLVTHFDWICGRAWADDLAAEVHQAHSVATAMAGTRELVHHLPAPCPECGLPSLVRHDGADHVRCENCGLSYDEASYRRLTLILAGEYGEAS